jgi:hypothetical protein
MHGNGDDDAGFKTLPMIPTIAPEVLAEAPQHMPGLEVDVVDTDDITAKGWPAIEVWTEPRVYHMDAAHTCFAVLDRRTGEPKVGHQLVGTRLCGGQRGLGRSVWLCHPLPLPGTVAVFERRDGARSVFLMSTPVERVIVRVGSRVVPSESAEATWNAIKNERQGGEPGPGR